MVYLSLYTLHYTILLCNEMDGYIFMFKLKFDFFTLK